MKICKERDKETKQRSVSIHVNSEEALRLISSLSQQLRFKSSKTGREEFVTENQEYFTIAVLFPEENPDVEEYKRAKDWGLTDEQFVEQKAKIKEWKEAQSSEGKDD